MAHTEFQTDPSDDDPRHAGEAASPADTTPVVADAPEVTQPPEIPLRFLFATAEERELETRWLVRAARALAERGHAVLLLAPENASWVQDVQPVPVRGVAWGGLLAVRAWLECRRGLSNHRPHCVVAGDARALQTLLRAGAAASERPLFLHTTTLPNGAASRLPHAVRGLLDPTSAADGARQDARLEWVADGIEGTNGAPPDRTLVRRELRLPRRAALVLHLAPLEAGEGHEDVLRSLGAAWDAGVLPPSLTVGFVGTGREESRLHVLAHELGVKEQVLWIGHRRNLSRYAAAADVILVPAATRAGSEALLLAAAAGVPVVAADVPLHRRRVEPEVTGLLVPPGDAAAFVPACMQLLTDPARASKLGHAARARAAALWSSTRLANEMESLVLTAALAASPGAPRALFVDRDGTLVRNVPYNCDPEAVVLEPDVARALGWLRRAGFSIVMVSNQSAVGRGICTTDQVRAVNDRIRDLLRAGGADVDAVYICPHRPEDGCHCRKPAPGLVLGAIEERGYDATASFMVGDEERDLEAGRSAGVEVCSYEGDWVALARAVLAMSARRTAPAARVARTRLAPSGGA